MWLLKPKEPNLVAKLLAFEALAQLVENDMAFVNPFLYVVIIFAKITVA